MEEDARVENARVVVHTSVQIGGEVLSIGEDIKSGQIPIVIIFGDVCHSRRAQACCWMPLSIVLGDCAPRTRVRRTLHVLSALPIDGGRHVAAHIG